MNQGKRIIILCIFLIFTIYFSGCDSKKALVTNQTVDAIIHTASKTKPKVETDLNDKVDYKKLLPVGYDWNIAKITTVNLNGNFTIVGAYCQRDKKPMLGQFFVFSKDNRLLWKSTEIETCSVLDEDAYIMKVQDKALVFGEYVWGGARGMMYSGIAFTLDLNNVVKEVNSDILLGLNGDVTVNNNSIVLEGEVIENKLELSMQDGIYKEKQVHDNKKKEITTISDMDNWDHPVKKLLDRYGIEIKKVELSKNSTYPTFYLGYTFHLLEECNYSGLRDIAEANGFWDYKKNMKVQIQKQILISI